MGLWGLSFLLRMKASYLSGGQEQGEPLNLSTMKEFSLSGGQEQRGKLLISASKALIPHLREGKGGGDGGKEGCRWWCGMVERGGGYSQVFSRESCFTMYSKLRKN